MRVYISKTVYAELTAFYAESLRRHITLDEYTVHRKIDRIISAIHELSDFPHTLSPCPIQTRMDRQRVSRYEI